MEKNIVIELRVLALEAETDDTTGYVRKAGGEQHEYLALRPVILLAPVVIRGFNPQPDPPVTVQPRDVQGFMRMETEPKGDGPGGGGPGRPFGLLTVIAVPIGQGVNTLAGLLGL